MYNKGFQNPALMVPMMLYCRNVTFAT